MKLRLTVYKSQIITSLAYSRTVTHTNMLQFHKIEGYPNLHLFNDLITSLNL